MFIAKDEIINPAGANRAAVLRHELGHCNGWSPDHTGARKVFMDEVQGPELPKTTKWLRAYPPLACLKPDGTEEPCADRVK
jgi:hypothetical protein